jgi:hypothetical protein
MGRRDCEEGRTWGFNDSGISTAIIGRVTGRGRASPARVRARPIEPEMQWSKDLSSHKP